MLTALLDCDIPDSCCFAIEQTPTGSAEETEFSRLREENSAFLRQVSEDFEELTFLRSMAEHLTLEESNQGLNRLTDYTLSLLGQIVGVEYLFYLDGRGGQPRVEGGME